MWLLATVRPAPPANPPSGSLLMWVLLTVVVALVVAGTVVFTSRR
jgi:cytochrome b